MTLVLARCATDAANERAAVLGVAISTAVVDFDGRLVTFDRMDGAALITVETAIAKAFTGAMFGRSGDELARLPADLVATLSRVHARGLMAGPGVAVLANSGDRVGFVGCSGGTGQQDQECANAGAEALTAVTSAGVDDAQLERQQCMRGSGRLPI